VLRFNFLSVVWVGLLVACRSNEQGAGAPQVGTTLAQESQSITTLTHRLDWNGAGGDSGCFTRAMSW
jgi:hypothetical protein